MKSCVFQGQNGRYLRRKPILKLDRPQTIRAIFKGRVADV